jgi:hypothetical protein
MMEKISNNNTTVRPYHVMHLAALGFKVVPLHRMERAPRLFLGRLSTKMAAGT